MLFDPGLTNVLRDALPGLGDIFLIITEVGSELVFIGVLLTLYWAVNKKEAILATYLLAFAFITNYWLKIIIAHERPPVSNWYPGADAPNYSTPSGHSQLSASLYGWFTVRVRKWWMVLVAVVLTGLVGISRIYLGVHFLGDVLLGWGVGIITVIAFVYLENPMRAFFSRYKQEYLLMGLAIIGFLMTFIAFLLPQPPNDNFGSVGGFTIGLALGLILENRFVGFSVEVPEGGKVKLVLRVIIGFILVFGVMLGLAPILPTEEIWLRTIRYTLIALIGVFIWPAIFKRINL
ncbi:MAG: phosphatase PAP2 family protein [Candidatus Thorarchaeota archaeon]